MLTFLTSQLLPFLSMVGTRASVRAVSNHQSVVKGAVIVRNLVFIIFFIFSGSALASVLGELKSTPATKYEVGILRLEMGALIVSRDLEGKPVGENGFKFQGARVEEKQDSVEFVFTVEGKAKDISEGLCQAIKKSFDDRGVVEEMKQEVWPGLSEAQYEDINDEFFMAVELVSRENSAFTLSCR